MTAFYSDLEQIFTECMADLDCRQTKLTLQRLAAGVMNPVTREFDKGTQTDIDITAFTIPFSKTVIDGQSILKGDVRVIMDNQTTPEQEDNVVIDGDNYSIISITPFNAGGIVLGHEIQVRR